MTDFDLERFVEAQADVHAQAVSELRAGKKQSHWMWFVFPQVAGLGLFTTALEKYFSGARDPNTIALLGGAEGKAP